MIDGIRVSFLLATYNRGAVLVDCLRRTLAAADAEIGPGRYEILVVDNASSDGTSELVAQAFSGRLQVIKLPHNEGPVAKNHALAAARGQYVVFLDDDAYPLPGALTALQQHLDADLALTAAVFDVMLPDSTREASAYPDVFIGAGTAFRKSVLDRVGGLPRDFFMQAEEYDLSFRILRAGGRIQRFADMPLRHLKTPGARIGVRTTRLDVRNNLLLLARYVPAPLCFELAADWLARYWAMAEGRDANPPPNTRPPTPETRHPRREHRTAFILGAAEGLQRWPRQRIAANLLPADVLETIFKFRLLRERLAAARQRHGFQRIVLADWGKNLLAYWRAARELSLEIVAIADDDLARPGRDYRGTPVRPWGHLPPGTYDAVIVSNLSPVAGPRRAAALRARLPVPVMELVGGELFPGPS